MEAPQLHPPGLTPQQLFEDLAGIAVLTLGHSIPWLVQASQEETNKLGPVWDMIEARTSHDAAVLYATTKAKADGFVPPFWVHVAPCANCLRHANGQPVVCRSFLVNIQPQITLSA